MPADVQLQELYINNCYPIILELKMSFLPIHGKVDSRLSASASLVFSALPCSPLLQ